MECLITSQDGRPRCQPGSGLACRLNHRRYSEWGSQPQKQAALAFDGPAYKALSAGTLGNDELQYLQSHLRILCGLYGVLRPLDLVKPYRCGHAPGSLLLRQGGGSAAAARLERRVPCIVTRAGTACCRLDMSKRLANSSGRDLYAFWRKGITSSLARCAATSSSGCLCRRRPRTPDVCILCRELQAQPEEVRSVVDCASQEYSKAVDRQALGALVVTLSFPGPAVYAKQARGSAARFAAVTRAKSPTDFKRFTGRRGLRSCLCMHAPACARAAASAVGSAAGSSGEWAFSEARSSEHTYVFLRTAGAAGQAGRASKADVGPADAGGEAPEPGRAARKRRRR